MTDVLLINPLAKINGRHAHFLRDWCGGEMPASLIYPPLDLAYVASFLKDNGVTVRLIDANVLHMPHRKIVEAISVERPRFVGIPSAWGSLQDDLNLCRMVKEKMPSVKTVLSGPNVTIEPGTALSSTYVDYAILGELEMPFLDIVKNRLGYNVAYKEGGKIVVKERKLFENLDIFPFPARELLPNHKYSIPFAKRNPITTMITSRGCPYRCNFCQVNIWYSDKIRFRSIDNVLSEIHEVVNTHKIREIVFRDQTLTVNKNRLMNLCREIIARKLDIHWRCFSCVDTVDEELLREMKRAGCYQIGYGFESGNQTVLDLSGKGTTLEQARSAAKLTKKIGIEVSGAFMFGMLGDTEETMKRTLNFALELDCDYAQFQLTSPVPSTKFYTQCKSAGFNQILPEQIRWYNWPVAENPAIPPRLLRRKLKEAYRKFYFRPSFIAKQLMAIQSTKQFIARVKTASELLKHA